MYKTLTNLKNFLLKYRFALLLICLINLIVYGYTLFHPYFFADDWWYAKLGANNEFSCPEWSFIRPFLFCWESVLYKILGVNPTALHLVNLITNILLGLLLFLLVIQFLPHNSLFNTFFIILFTVFPSDLSHTWFTISAHRFVIILFFVSFIFLILFIKYEKKWFYAISILLLIPSFFIYEYHVGLAFIIPFLIYLKWKPKDLFMRLALLAYAIIPIIFSLWRAVGQKLVGIADAGIYSVNLEDFSILSIISRLIIGYRIHFQWSWTEVLIQILPFLKNISSNRNIYAFMVFGLLVLFFVGLSMLVEKISSRHQNSGHVYKFSLASIKPPAFLFLIGLVIIGFGYFPIITIWIPWMGFYNSRMNILPAIEAALSITACIYILGILLGKKNFPSSRLLFILTIPFIFLGVTAQILVEHGAEQAWREQLKVWNHLFDLIPGIASNSSIYLIEVPPHETNIFSPYPFADGNSGLGFSSGLSLFYNDETLHGVALGQIPKLPEFTPAGIVRPWGIDKCDQVIFLKYNRHSDILSIENELSELIKGDFTPTGYQPFIRIIPYTEDSTKFRDLVK